MIILHSRKVSAATLNFCREMFAPSVELEVREVVYAERALVTALPVLGADSGFLVKLRHHTFTADAIGDTMQDAITAVYWSWRRWLQSDEYLEIAIPAVITGVHDLVVPK